MTKRINIDDLNDLGSDVNIAGTTGMDIDVDTKGLNHRELDRMRDKIYPNVIRSFQKHSQIMKKILDGAVQNLNDPEVIGGHLKCIYCRIKFNISSTGESTSETYSRELVASVDFKEEERNPEISYRTTIDIQTKDGDKQLPLEVDALVMKFLQNVNEEEARSRVANLARKKTQLSIEQFIPIGGVTKIVMAAYPLPGSIRLGGAKLGRLTDKLPNMPTASITIQICYEDENCQCSYCEDFTFGTVMA